MSLLSEENIARVTTGTMCLTTTGGLAATIWAAARVLQPALANSNGFSKKGADWTTAGIALFGGVEAGTMAGWTAGAILCCAAALCTICCSRTDGQPDGLEEQSEDLIDKTLYSSVPAAL